MAFVKQAAWVQLICVSLCPSFLSSLSLLRVTAATQVRGIGETCNQKARRLERLGLGRVEGGREAKAARFALGGKFKSGMLGRRRGDKGDKRKAEKKNGSSSAE